MDYQSSANELMGVTRDQAAEPVGIPAHHLQYAAWPQVFGSTAGPFKGVGGASMSTFTIEAWYYNSKALIFCKGKVLKLVDDFRMPIAILF